MKNFSTMTDNELLNLAAEYNHICETMEAANRNYGKSYYEYATTYNACINECKRRGLNTMGL